MVFEVFASYLSGLSGSVSMVFLHYLHSFIIAALSVNYLGMRSIVLYLIFLIIYFSFSILEAVFLRLAPRL